MPRTISLSETPIFDVLDSHNRLCRVQSPHECKECCLYHVARTAHELQRLGKLAAALGAPKRELAELFVELLANS